MMKKLVREYTGVRLAPQDTAGQRQGLVAAMQGNPDSSKEFLGAAEVAAGDTSMLSLLDIQQVTNEPDDETAKSIAIADKHHMLAISGEFSRFIGANNLQMLDFLTTMWDGDDYDYRLKSSEVTLKSPLLNILGCTTPTSMANSLPPSAGGQGFLSRVILVYGARKYKSVARPTVPDVELVNKVGQTLSNSYYQLNGPFDETADGRAYSESLYGFDTDISDSRFGYYDERRYTHLIKLAMCLTAGRGDSCITRTDYEEAQRILSATEKGMPDALGEFGMNPLAAVKQQMLDKLRDSQQPMPVEQLVAMFHRDARSHELREVINELTKMNQVKVIQQSSGQIMLAATYNRRDTEDTMLTALKSGD